MYSFLNSRWGTRLFLLVFASLFAACGFVLASLIALKTGLNPAYTGGTSALLSFATSLYLMAIAVARVSKGPGIFLLTVWEDVGTLVWLTRGVIT